jgi:hypothetical protein
MKINDLIKLKSDNKIMVIIEIYDNKIICAFDNNDPLLTYDIKLDEFDLLEETLKW